MVVALMGGGAGLVATSGGGSPVVPPLRPGIVAPGPTTGRAATGDPTSTAGPALATGPAPATEPASVSVPGPSSLPSSVTDRRAVEGMRIVIPGIGVNAPVVALGLNADGTLQVPQSFTVAGWWSGGALPGQPGPAVIVGHVSSKAGPGVFYRLGELAAGDTVTVDIPGDARVEFRVTGALEVPKSAFPTSTVYGPGTRPELRLITCAGEFDARTGHFLDDVIVLATLVGSTSAGAA